MLTIITPTGTRPQAFALCERMMARQTYTGPVEWYIVDDGETQTPVTFEKPNFTVYVLRPEPFWKPGDNTQGRNILEAISAIGDMSHRLLTVWEDDDWYAPEWLQAIVDRAHIADLIGEGDATYYNVRTGRWRRLGNHEHASLRCSAMSGNAIDTFKDVLSTPHRYYDMKLWAKHPSRHVFDTRLTVGMKSMPGRPGIALGHDGLRGNPDPDGAKLRELIGADAEWYAQFKEDYTMIDRKPIVIKPFRYGRKNYKPGDIFDAVKRIDIELHVHAQKVQWQAVEDKPKRRQMKIETPEARMIDSVIEKAVEPVEEPAEKTIADEQPETEDKPRWGRRGRKPAAKDE